MSFYLFSEWHDYVDFVFFPRDDSSFTIYEEKADIHEQKSARSETAGLSEEQKVQIHTDFITAGTLCFGLFLL